MALDFTAPQIAAYAGSWFGIMGGVWALFDRASNVIKPDARNRISQWVTGLDFAAKKNWPATFAEVFDQIFGKKHLSWRCFFRSALASMIAVLLLALLWRAAFSELAIVGDDPIKFAWGVLAIGALLNLIPDYMSLLQSRIVIRYMAKKRSSTWIAGLLVLDLVLTAAVVLVAFSILALLMDTAFGAKWNWKRYWDLVADGFLARGWNLFGIFFYSTFFTSVWVWLYALSGFAVSGLAKTQRGLNFLRNTLDFENKPLKSMGFVSMI